VIARELPRCACGKAIFRSRKHAREAAGIVHSERIRVYRCEHGSVHVAAHEKTVAMMVTRLRASSKKARHRKARHRARKKCSEESGRWNARRARATG
jgi:hypothetical protein